MKKQKTAYLAGAMESVADEGLGWRRKFSRVLKNKVNVKCIIPNDEEKNIKKRVNMAKVKRTDPEKYLRVMREFIRMDLEFVESVDMIVIKWEGEATFGTVHEAGWAYQLKKPCYLITGIEEHKLPGWFYACCTKVFHSLDELIEHLKEN
jgi:nucleoside 2-deoxyribosyltransferase